MRKWLFGTVAVLLILSMVLVACGATEAPEPTEAAVEPTEAAPEPTQAAPEPTEPQPRYGIGRGWCGRRQL
jgi:hypothetical protein